MFLSVQPDQLLRDDVLRGGGTITRIHELGKDFALVEIDYETQVRLEGDVEIYDSRWDLLAIEGVLP